jgi:translation initiation factor 5B
MKIEAQNTEQGSRVFGRHFDHTDHLVSKISRESINALKAHFADEMSKDDWRLVSVGWVRSGLDAGGGD